MRIDSKEDDAPSSSLSGSKRSRTSCVHAFYKVAGRYEPLEPEGLRVASGKILVRKVGS